MIDIEKTNEEISKKTARIEKEPDQFKMNIKKDYFEYFLKSVLALADEGILNTNEDGIATQIVDPANVCMALVSLKNGGIEEYSFKESKIALPFGRISKLLDGAKKDDGILIEYLPAKNKMRIAFENIRYDTALLSLDAIRKDPKIPEIKLPIKVTLNSNNFRHVITSAKKINDKITFKANIDGIIIESTGISSDMSFRMDKEDMIDFDISSDAKEVKSSFSLDYLENISKVMTKSDNTSIWFGINHPCRIMGTFANGYGTVEYLLAPIIEDGY